jgi:primosomal protein N' (replication factor Y)
VEGEVFVQAFTPFHPAIQYARRHDFAGFYEQEIEFREQLKYPPVSRAALLTLKGRNEDKVRFVAEHVRVELDKFTTGTTGKGEREKRGSEENDFWLTPAAPPPLFSSAPFRDLIIAGPAPAPLLRAETYFRYQIMLRTRQMSALSLRLAALIAGLKLPEDVTLTVDIDPVSLT